MEMLEQELSFDLSLLPLRTPAPHPPPPPPPHHGSHGNLSEGNVSDTISESSDNATLLSLSREDLVALGAGHIREDIRVNRKKLEGLIIRERDHPHPTGRHYMEMLMERTNTYIQWPSRMKVGAKTKKDLYIRVYGHNQDDVNDAKEQILNDLGPHRDLRITLKMEISYTDHSHLIGCRGQTIRKVMDDTGCHIHFPDSNRMSKEHKSNQVTIAGSSVGSVEQARSRVRELSPLVFQFGLPSLHSPYEMQINPDNHHVFIENVQSSYGVQVTIHPPNKLQQTSVSVKGCEMDASAVMEAVSKIIQHFSCGPVTSVHVESSLEISAVQHPFVRAINDSNVHSIMMNTGAKIQFPDLSDGNIQQIKRSRVIISGDINCVYNARQQLLGCLPLRMIFDLSDDFQLDWESVRQIGSELNVNVKMINRNRAERNSTASLPPLVPGRSRTIQLIAHERNTSNMFEVRRRILGGTDQMFLANIPTTYHLRPIYPSASGNRLGVPLSSLPPLMLPSSPSMLSPVLSPSFWPPTPFSSPFCSPPITMVNNGGSQNAFATYREPPGIGKLTLNLQPGMGYGFNSNMLSPNPDMTALKHSFHLPLDNNYRAYSSDSSLNTPMSLGGTSSLSDLSPLSLHHPAIGMVNALINEGGPMDMNRRAPGCERSSTMPNLYSNLGNLTETQEEVAGIGNVSNGEHEGGDTSAADGKNEDSSSSSGIKSAEDKVSNPTNEKKYMAVKAMFQSKIGNSFRVPTSEWSGCGFSRTYTNLFPSTSGGDASSGGDSGFVTGTNGTEEMTNDSEQERIRIHHPQLGHQQSNLLDFAATRPISDNPPTDLASLFIQNGLEKYIDTFLSEEIDLDIFSTLNEGDLRSLGVSAYPARKRMLVIITQLAVPRPSQDWN